MELISKQTIIYHPILDINNGTYIDECPIPPYNRHKSIEYHCLCNNQHFYNMTEYKKHIKLKSHERYLKNYLHYINDLEHAKEQAIEYRTLYETTNRQLNNITILYQRTKDELKHLIEIINIGKEMENVD